MGHQDTQEAGDTTTVTPSNQGVPGAVKRMVKSAWLLHERTRQSVREEILQVNDLMPLLMKPRNGQPWTKAERAELLSHLRRISRLGLYITALAVPGTTLTLPFLAWWLDRRRTKRQAEKPTNSKSG